MKVIVLLVLLGLFALCTATSDGCESICAKRFLHSKQTKGRGLRRCISQCHKLGHHDDTVKLMKKLKTIRSALKKNIQDVEATPMSESESLAEAEAEAGANPKKGDTLVVTSSNGINVRTSPCVKNDNVAGTMANGATATATGEVANGCGYTWYKITTGRWVASNYVRVQSGGGGGGGSTCRTRSYPLFKQCGQSWSGHYLGDKTICAVGCLMSSVSMAMNGLGKKIDGQAVNPGTLNSYLKRSNVRGYQGNLYVWTAVAPFGLRYQGQFTDKNIIKKHVCNNQVVILNVNNGGHWVLATGVAANGDFLTNDPGAGRSSFRPSEVSRAGIYFV